MKILHRIRGETGKRCLSFFLAFAMLLGLIPTIFPSAEAAQTGVVTSADATVTANGTMHIWGTGIVHSPGSGKGGVGLDIIEDKSEQVPNGVYVEKYIKRSTTWIDQSKGTFAFDFEFYPSTGGTHTFQVGLYDTTSGIWRAISSSDFKYKWSNVTGLSAVPISMASAPRAELSTVNPSDTKFSFQYRNKFDGGSRITRSTLYWTKEGTAFTAANSKALEVNTVYWNTDWVSGLIPGTTYQVKMESENAVGVATSNIATVTVGTPSAPQNIKSIPGNNAITVTWDEPAELRGGTLQGYKLYATSTAGAEPIATVGANVHTYTLSDKNNGFMEGFGYIRAYTQYGIGAIGIPPQVWIGSPVPPTAPTLTKTAGSRSVRISVNAPENNGAAITQYNIYVNGAFKKAVSGATLNDPFDWKTDLGLADNTTYSVAVSATNSRGEGPQSPASSFTTNGPPAKPTLSNAEATKVTGQVKLTWTTPANNGGPITAVQVLQNGSVVKTLSASGTPNEWQSGMMDTPGQTCAYFVTGLTDGTTYKFQVRAVNAYGQGVLSDFKSAMPYCVPEPPTGLKVTSGVRSLTLSWTPGFNGGNSVSKYNVYDSAKAH